MSTKKLQILGSFGVEVDSTLTQAGKAADAQVVGDALAGKQPVGDYALASDIPDVPAWALAETKPTYTAEAVGADPVGTAASTVSAHNTATDTHNDIRLLIEGLTSRLNALADSDDTTLDQMSEIVAYIKSNKGLIDSITTDKVSVSDIIDNLTTNVTNKPLSAAQGVALKGLIDNLNTNKLDASALDGAVDDALAQAKASGEFDGAKGEDGYSPVRGTDYWTEADKAEIKAYVDEAILGGEW